ncbi:MAG: UDP-N-acetylglucosamine diphosphorylase [Methanobacteriota archaeon]|nr:MAG: UDP-N-acetylglucosamine diphosphorylase [Euryarchaeota archaeon]|tara:strand:- start:16004 stop:16735 length:732 start_codon:yes stop_codon:yes gene_type:complete
MAEANKVVNAIKLWPSVEKLNEYWDERDCGYHPKLILDNLPPWAILDESSKFSLKNQLDQLLSSIGSYIPESIESEISIDETNGAVHISEGAIIGAFTRFEGPCYIGPESVIRHGAYVRQYSWICHQALLGHASEIKHSILLPNAKAPHFNYVGDSVVGSFANLGAGVILSNLRHDGKENKIRIDKTVVNTQLRKFGALVGERVQIGCNSVCNPGTIISPNCMAWPNTTLSGYYDKGGSKIRN